MGFGVGFKVEELTRQRNWYRYCASHSRYFWGVRLHALFATNGTPRALEIASPKKDRQAVGLELLGSCRREGGKILLADKGYTSREFAGAIKQPEATVVWPQRKDILTLKRHQARILAGLKERILQCFSMFGRLHHLNYQLGHPRWVLVNYYR